MQSSSSSSSVFENRHVLVSQERSADKDAAESKRRKESPDVKDPLEKKVKKEVVPLAKKVCACTYRQITKSLFPPV